jgi:hypothetical protein
MEVSGELHSLITLPLGNNPVSHQIGGWVCHRGGGLGGFGEEKISVYMVK